MTDDPKKPFGQPPTSPVQPGQPTGQDGFGQPPAQQPPAQQPPAQGYGHPVQPQAPAPQQQPGPQQPGFGGPPPGHQPQQGFGQAQGGFGMQQGQSAYVNPAGPQGGPPELPTGLKVTSTVLLIVGSVLTVVGLVPCLGILNWLAFPLNATMALIGTLGLVIGPKLGDGKPANMTLHISAIVVGILLAAVSFFRCIAGGGIA